MTSQLKVDRISPATGSEIIIDGWERNKKNLIINGAMTVSQRGETFDGGDYTLDRWYIGSSGYNISRGTAPHQFDYSLKCVRPPEYSANSLIQQRIELDKKGSPGIFVQGKEFTMSCWVKGTAGAEFSMRMGFSEGTGTGETRTYFSDGSSDGRGNVINLTGGWNRYENTVTVDQPCNSEHNSVCLTLSYYGSAVNQTVWIAGVQAEKGHKATEFEHESLGQTVAKCQRYYCKSYNLDIAPQTNNASGRTYFYLSPNTTDGPKGAMVSFPVLMRSAPTVTIYNEVSGVADVFSNGASANVITAGQRAFMSYATSIGDDMYAHWVAEAEL